MPSLSPSRTLLLTILFALVSIKAFSQPVQMNIIYHPDKASDRKAVRFISRMGPSPEFNPYYTKFMDHLNGRSRKDSLLADALIFRLNRYKENAFYRLLQVRLIWNFKQRLLAPLLDNTIPYLNNAADSANYFYTKGVYYKDSTLERIARKMGYVRAGPNGEEYVDWRKMSMLRFTNPKKMEILHQGPYEVFKPITVRDSAIFYYKKAIEYDKKEILYLSGLIYAVRMDFYNDDEREKEIQALLFTYLSNYSPKDQKRLRKKLQQ